jgi:hypothetical protein
VARWRADLQYYLAKLSVFHSHRRLLLKNPAHSARLEELQAIFPGAAFIHIHRDPADVLPSTRKLYRTMLPLVALQDYDMTMVERHIASAYPALMDALFRGLATLPARQVVEVAYDDLVRAPLETIERIYQELDLKGFGEARAAMQSLVPSAGNAQREVHAEDAAFGKAMTARLAPYRGRLGYAGDQALGDPA